MKRSEIEEQIRQMRKDQNQGGVLVSHFNDAGVSTPNSGDDEAPFVKENPFVTEPELYVSELSLPDLAQDSPVYGPTIDVKDYRLLKVYIEFAPRSMTASQLGVFPESAPETPAQLVRFYPIGVIDAVITASDVYGQRTLYETELVTPASTSTVRVSLAFDVAVDAMFRLGFGQYDPGDTQGAGVVTVQYVLSM